MFRGLGLRGSGFRGLGFTGASRAEKWGLGRKAFGTVGVCVSGLWNMRKSPGSPSLTLNPKP